MLQTLQNMKLLFFIGVGWVCGYNFILVMVHRYKRHMMHDKHSSQYDYIVTDTTRFSGHFSADLTIQNKVLGARIVI